MRLIVRIAAIVTALAVLLFATVTVVVYFNQQRIVGVVLASVKNQTGIDISAPSSHIAVRRHLVVELDHPRVMAGNREIVSLEKIRAIVNFRSIFTHGLPLRELDLVHPLVTAPFDAAAASNGPLPRPSRDLINDTIARFGDLARISRRFVISGMELRDRAGTILLHDADLVASHRRATPKLWTVNFKTDCEFPKIKGAQAAGNFNLGQGGNLPATETLQGTFWFWQLPIQHLTIGNIDADGEAEGKVKFSVAHDGAIDGVTTLAVKALSLRSPDLSAPLEVGDYKLEARFSTSSDRVEISSARLSREGNPVVAGQGYVSNPMDRNPEVAFGIAELTLAWKDIVESVRSLKRMPQELEVLVHHLKSGRIEIAKASVESSLGALENLSLKSILSKLSVTATLSELSFATPPETRLPDVADAGAQIIFAKQTLSLLQGSAKIGNSELRDLEAKVDLSRTLDEVPYQISMKADLDLAELRPALMKLLDQFNVHERDRLETLAGDAHAELEASGKLQKNLPTRPEKYLVKIEPRGVTVGFRGAPGPIGVASGVIVAQPDVIRLERVSARATGGTADFDGELQIGEAGMHTAGLRITMHQMPIDRWLEGVVDPDDFSATGNLGGEVVITGDLQHGFLANGKVTLLSGRVDFGFLRSPIFVHPAIATIRDRTLVVSMPAAELEKSPIDFIVTVQDVRNPSVRIDANVQRLDVEVLKFVRLPWMPPTPTHPPKLPISGHIDAREANLESFAMKNAKTDFKYSNGDWSVDNLTASGMEGRLSINIVGRKKDDWIHIFGKTQNMNVASIFLLNRKVTRSPIAGRLDTTADLWADTNSNFFATMAGTAILKLRDGNLNRFTLLSRLLELIDLRSWLTANIPDPRTSGLQFRTVAADFKGSDGVFYTDDLILDGPVIDIVANGNINVDQSTLDMKVGMIPFNTVNWLLSNIPLVGENVAGSTKSIIAAYFNVRGPISDPSVTPAPITSVAELVKKIVGLPINLIKPDTIK